MSNSPFPGAVTEATTPRKHLRDSISTTTVEVDSIDREFGSWGVGEVGLGVGPKFFIFCVA